MGQGCIGEDLSETHAGAELRGDDKAVLAVLAESGLDRVRHGEGRVVHRRHRPVPEVAEILGHGEQDDRILAVPHPRGGTRQGRWCRFDERRVHRLPDHDHLVELVRKIVGLRAAGLDGKAFGVGPAIVIGGNADQIGTGRMCRVLDPGRGLLRRAEIDLLGCPVPQHRERVEKAVATIVGLVHLGEHVGDVPGRIAERIVVLLVPLRRSPVGEGSAVGGVERLGLVGVDIGVVPGPTEHIVDLTEPLEIRTDTETARGIRRVDRHRDAGSGFRPLRGIASTGVHGGTLGRPAPTGRLASPDVQIVHRGDDDPVDVDLVRPVGEVDSKFRRPPFPLPPHDEMVRRRIADREGTVEQR